MIVSYFSLDFIYLCFVMDDNMYADSNGLWTCGIGVY